MAKTPPVPPANRSPKGPGSAPADKASDIAREVDKRDRNLEQQGRQGNTNINTHHQGYQQDR
jgi:hypothetical protein